MAASNGAISNGTTFKYSSDNNSFTTLGEIVSISAPSMSATDVDFSHLTSDDNFKEYKAGMRDAGTVVLDLHYYDTDTATLYAVFAAGTNYYWRIEYNDDNTGGAAQGSRWDFRGYMNQFEPGTATADERMSSTIGIKLTAKPTYTAAP